MSFYNFFDFKGTFPEIFLLVSICYFLTVCVFNHSSWSKNYNMQLFGTDLSYLIILCTMLLIVIQPSISVVSFNGLLLHDNFTYFIKFVVLFFAFIVFVISKKYLTYFRNQIYTYEYPTLLLLSILGIFCLISSYDFISLYLAIELQSLCFYALATFNRERESSTEAGLKYFVLGAVSSGILLFGFSIIYGLTGITKFDDLTLLFLNISDLDYTINGILFGIVFILVALLFKLGAAPFHMWLPDVYEGSPTSITAFFAVVPKIAIISLVIRLFYTSFYGLVVYWQDLFVYAAILSMVVGCFGALFQRKIKRFLAYSAIAHVGYILIGLVNGTPEGIQSVLIYMVIYGITTICVFYVFMSLYIDRDKYNVNATIYRIKNNSRIYDKEIYNSAYKKPAMFSYKHTDTMTYISELKHLGLEYPLPAFVLVVCMFSMAGVPPLAGFWSKMYIFMSSIQSSMYLLALVGILTSVISAFYYLRIIKNIYFDDAYFYGKVDRLDLHFKLKVLGLGPLLYTLTFFVVFFFVFPSPLFTITHDVSLALCL